MVTNLSSNRIGHISFRTSPHHNYHSICSKQLAVSRWWNVYTQCTQYSILPLPQSLSTVKGKARDYYYDYGYHASCGDDTEEEEETETIMIDRWWWVCILLSFSARKQSLIAEDKTRREREFNCVPHNLSWRQIELQWHSSGKVKQSKANSAHRWRQHTNKSDDGRLQCPQQVSAVIIIVPVFFIVWCTARGNSSSSSDLPESESHYHNNNKWAEEFIFNGQTKQSITGVLPDHTDH